MKMKVPLSGLESTIVICDQGDLVSKTKEIVLEIECPNCKEKIPIDLTRNEIISPKNSGGIYETLELPFNTSVIDKKTVNTN